MTDGVRYLLPLILGSAAIGVVLLASAWMGETTVRRRRVVTIPGPGTMESRLHVGHLADVLDARRQWDREGVER